MIEMILKSESSEGRDIQVVLNRLARKADHRCPKCASIVYSRNNRFCGVCGMVLPESVLFSDAERARMQELKQAERQRHKAWMNRRDESSCWQLA